MKWQTIDTYKLKFGASEPGGEERYHPLHAMGEMFILCLLSFSLITASNTEHCNSFYTDYVSN